MQTQASQSAEQHNKHYAYVRQRAVAAKTVTPQLALLTTAQKNAGLEAIATELTRSASEILSANAQDMEAGKAAGLGSRLDRILLTQERIEAICNDIANVISLPDPVGTILDTRTRPNGLEITRERCPIGVVGIIYEARPNVTVDATVLCLKAGNAVVLKGGSDAIHSNRAVVAAIHRALSTTDIPPEAVQFIDETDRAATQAFLTMDSLIDVVVPRGSFSLIQFARKNATVPVIETGASVVHVYVDEEVDIAQAVDLIINAKTRRVSICGALDTLLLHQAVAEKVSRPLAEKLSQCEPKVQVRAVPQVLDIFQDSMAQTQVRPLDPASDFDTEFLDHILAVGVVEDMDAALAHIEKHSLHHTEAIYTTNIQTAEKFMRSVDSAVVMHNVSTQFTDGAEFGLGAEIGISTQKLHVRGPFALEGLTSMKWVVRGKGQVRP